MFAQVVRARAKDQAGLRKMWEKAEQELTPGAIGYLGATGGIADDGTMLVVARFESESAARQNSDRPEQGAWWEELAALFTDEPVFHDSTYVEVDQHGDPDAAGFVQVMQGRTKDPDRARELMAADPTDWATYRPDILGTITVGHGTNDWTMAIYFTSEEAAREGERKEPTPEMAEMMEEMNALADGEPTFHDLRDPWLASP